MIKIIHPGTISFEDVCPDCLCLFSYDRKTLHLRRCLIIKELPWQGFFKIKCPYCGDMMTIVGDSERKLGYFTDKVKKGDNMSEALQWHLIDLVKGGICLVIALIIVWIAKRRKEID